MLIDGFDAFFPYDGTVSARGHYGSFSRVRDLMMQLVATSLIYAEHEMLVEALSELSLLAFSPTKRGT